MSECQSVQVKGSWEQWPRPGPPSAGAASRWPGSPDSPRLRRRCTDPEPAAPSQGAPGGRGWRKRSQVIIFFTEKLF